MERDILRSLSFNAWRREDVENDADGIRAWEELKDREVVNGRIV